MSEVLSLHNLTIQFTTKQKKTAEVLDKVNTSVSEGEILGLVGESGCGKSMTALAIMGLLPKQAKVVSGEINFEGHNLVNLNDKEWRKIRGNRLSMIFQEPMTSLNPLFKAGDQIAEGLRVHQNLNQTEAHRKAVELLRKVGIPEPEIRAHNYPHQLSGGMRQRVMIAMALACRPKLLIADEPTTALDVTVQAQIFDLMRTLQKEMGTAIILITHDLEAISDLADRVAVMYAGRIIETAAVKKLLSRPSHPYTQGLIHCVPRIQNNFASREYLPEIPGVVPSLNELSQIQGCCFAERCAFKHEKCRKKPDLLEIVEGHSVACWESQKKI